MTGAARAKFAPDAEALLVALVLDPGTYSRNRFFDLHTDPDVRRVRRRAALVRGVLRHLVTTRDAERSDDVLELLPLEDGWVDLTYTVRRLALRRTMRLDPLEVSLIRFAMARRRGAVADLDEVDRARIETALRRLAGPLGEVAAPGRPPSEPSGPPDGHADTHRSAPGA